MSLNWLAVEEKSWYARLYAWLTEPLFTIGDASFSTANLLKLLLFAAVLVWAARAVRRILQRRVFPRTQMDRETALAFSTLIYYGLLVLGLLVGLQAAGIDVSALTVLAGALGVGIGFGLQTIASNFVSGLIILFEKPVRIGDRIQVADLHGRVARIGARATEIVTNDGISVIVPNSEFVSQRVVNWSLGEDRIRIHVPVGVAYGSDPEKVRQALLEAASSVDAVLRDPPPRVRFRAFGESALEFELLGWTKELLHARGEFVSRLNFAIHDSLKRHGIEIPYPQRVVHLKGPIGATLGPDSPPGAGQPRPSG
jgi:small-conductance mechanosensitive channel